MNSYIIGDVQGCFSELLKLLDLINFDSKNDKLIFAGDIVNRGPDSLKTIRYIKSLPNAEVILGNHDIHLISLCYGHQKESSGDTLTNVLDATDKIEIIEWLRHRPLIIKDKDYTVVHAGIPPIWSTDNALVYSSEVCSLLQSDNEINSYLKNLYSNNLTPWSKNLTGPTRRQLITNYLTRMRYCTQQGSLGFTKQQIIDCHFKPWFTHKKNKLNYNEKIIFGHWSKLNGKTGSSNIIAIDTGCVWGGALTAYDASKNTRYSIQSTINRIAL